MATPEDLRANCEYIRLADEYVEITGGTNNYNYANVNVIVDVAERTRSEVLLNFDWRGFNRVVLLFLCWFV